MGQSDSKEISQTVSLLEKQNIIERMQAQKFLHDYHTKDPAIEDVKNFDKNKLKIFLKYFIMHKYTGRNAKKLGSKRTEINQSALISEDRILHNLIGLLCFETYRIDETSNKIYQLIMNFALKPTQQSFNKAIIDILKIIGIKQCSMVVLNKSNAQELKIAYNQQRQQISIKEKGLQRSPYPRSQKYRFRRMNKTELVKQKLIQSEKQFSSDTVYIEEIPTKQKTSVLMIGFDDIKLMKPNPEITQLRDHIEKFLSFIGEFLAKMVSLNHFEENDLVNQSACYNSGFKLQSSNEQNKNAISQICWALLKIYKNFFDFEHCCFVQKLRRQNKTIFHSNLSEFSFEKFKLQLLQYIKGQSFDNESQQQIIDFLTRYEKLHSSIKNDLSDYLQKYFQAITKDLLQFQFDSNTELKFLLVSKETVENQCILQKIRQIMEQGNTPSLLDIFQDQKSFEDFYKKSYQESLSDYSKQKNYEHEGVNLRLKFQQQVLQSIKIQISFQSLAEKEKVHNNNQIKMQKSCSKYHHKRNKSNKQNQKILNKYRAHRHSQMPKSSLIEFQKKMKIPKISNQVYVFSNAAKFNLYDLNLNVLQMNKPEQFRLAYELIQQQGFYKQKNEFASEKLLNFLEELREGYEEHQNSFHNFTHGVNVLHTSFLLTNIQKVSNYLSDLTKFILLISALCHDVGHTGFNNAFQVASRSQIAEIFNDVSPLQNYHISRTFAILKKQECDFLDFLSNDERLKFRKLLISNILNTDMKEHFNVLKKYQEKMNNFKKDDFEDEKIISGMLIHSSDFGASTKDFKICQDWSRLVNEQFKKQSSKQSQLNLPLSPFMLNLDNQLVFAKNQMGFLKFMVQPLYKAISQFYGSDPISDEMLNNINKNISRWQNIVKDLAQ